VLEVLNKRDLAAFAFAFGFAGCLMVWTINLSIDRLLYADWDRTAPAPIKLTVQSPQQDRPGCRGSRIAVPQMATSRLSAEARDPCHTAELEPKSRIRLR